MTSLRDKIHRRIAACVALILEDVAAEAVKLVTPHPPTGEPAAPDDGGFLAGSESAAPRVHLAMGPRFGYTTACGADGLRTAMPGEVTCPACRARMPPSEPAVPADPLVLHFWRWSSGGSLCDELGPRTNTAAEVTCAACIGLLAAGETPPARSHAPQGRDSSNPRG